MQREREKNKYCQFNQWEYFSVLGSSIFDKQKNIKNCLDNGIEIIWGK